MEISIKFSVFLVKPYFLFLQYRKSVLKKTQIFGPLFEPCSSCVAVDSFFFQKNDDLWEKQTPQRVIFRTFLSKCPNVDFFGGGPAEGLAKKLRNAPSEGLIS